MYQVSYILICVLLFIYKYINSILLHVCYFLSMLFHSYALICYIKSLKFIYIYIYIHTCVIHDLFMFVTH